MDKCYGEKLIAAGSAIAFNLAQNCSPQELSVLGGFFTAIGDQLSLLSTTKEIFEAKGNCK